VSGKDIQYSSSASGRVFKSGLTATGGITTTTYGEEGSFYKSHIFTATDTFTVTSVGELPQEVEVLIVAGGGSGGCNGAGGGGAGGFRVVTFPVSVSPGSYTASVGAGGAPVAFNVKGNNGTPSWFGIVGVSTETSTGGGGGGFKSNNYGTISGNSGGSGGGTAATGPGIGYFGGAGNVPPTSPPQGNPGGNSVTGQEPNNYAGGGGGGAGGAGNPSLNESPTFRGGHGGIGTSNSYAYGPTSPTIYAGGGGGAGNIRGDGGSGGGGNGSSYGSAENGVSNTGGGGGGAYGLPSVVSGAGGSGIIVVRYRVSSIQAQA
jgi:hypothetical protein